jgi:serine protease SohB
MLMMDFLLNYGLFLAKTVTLVFFIIVVILLIVSASQKNSSADDQIEIKNLSKKFANLKKLMLASTTSKKEFKQLQKQDKQSSKKESSKTQASDQRVFVINFVGNIKATAVKHLRKEITALLSIATDKDEVVICLENSGGLVHEHGLAASQLQRIRQRGIPLTVAVDKVAASGGYMMACVADRIIAAPFSVLGSIGVIAQMPNFNKLLERHGIEYEQIKAGDLKRTITMFGKNTDQDRAHFTEQMQETHDLFKEFVAENRTELDMEQVATGEHWLGKKALQLKLVDELMTSDDYLLQKSQEATVYEITHRSPKSVGEKLMGNVQSVYEKTLTQWWEKNLFS